MATTDALMGIITPIAQELSVDLYDFEYTGGVVKVTVTADGGIDLDTIGEFTKRLSRQLDLDDPIAGRYTLEVTSPGLERTLRKPSHWAAAVGELVRVKLKPMVDGERRFEGVVVSSTEESATLEVDGAPVDVAFDHVDRARTVFEWGPQPKKGGPKPASQKKNSSKPTSVASTSSDAPAAGDDVDEPSSSTATDQLNGSETA